MNGLDRTLAWAEDNRDLAFDLVRVYLGLGLLVRGMLFVGDSGIVLELLDGAGEAGFGAAAVGHLVALAHLGGGLLLALGLLTRLAALVQIPILFGAVFLVHLGEGLLAAGQSLEFSALVLFLLVLFAIFGAGRFSLDHAIATRRWEREQEDEQLPLFDADRPSAPRPVVSEEGPVAPREERAPVPQYAPPPLPSGEQPCTHGRDRHHPRVYAESRFGLGGRWRFLTGTTGRPRVVVFRCQDCGGVTEVSTRAEDTRHYAYFDR